MKPEPVWDGVEHHRLFMERVCAFVTSCTDCAFGFEGSREDSAMMWRTHKSARGHTDHTATFTLKCPCGWASTNMSTGMLDAEFLDHIVTHRRVVKP